MIISYDIVTIVIITALIQSLFGVGILLFGTPLMLSLGYGFINAIVILLPISFAISTIQASKHFNLLDIKFCRYIIVYSAPVISIVLFYVVNVKMDMSLAVGLFIIFVALKDFFIQVEKIVVICTKNIKVYMIIMGVVHGLTNLGGSLLTAVIHTRNFNKDTSRATIAGSYGIFAIFQIFTLIISDNRIDINIMEIFFYTIIGISVFMFTEKHIYFKINSLLYKKYFALFLLFNGIFLCVKNI